MQFEPRDEHRWLHRLVGDWTFEGEAVMGPDQPPARMTGRERVRMLGDAWAMLLSRSPESAGVVGGARADRPRQWNATVVIRAG